MAEVQQQTIFNGQPLNILVLNWQCWLNPFAGGAETHLREIFKRLAEEYGHKITLYCCSFPGAKQREMLDGITIIREGHRNLFNYMVAYRYWKTQRHEEFDIVIDDINKIPFFTPLFVRKPLLAIAHHFFGTSIFKEVGILGGSYVYGAEMLVPTVYRAVSIITVSESTRQEFYQRGFRKEQCSIIPNCIDMQAFSFCVQEKPPDPHIVYCGRLKRYKSIDHLLRAFAVVLHRHPSSVLTIAGRGEAYEELQHLAHELRIAESVKFVGFVSEEEKIVLLSRAHCLVNPSMKEGWGIVNIEANACGTPVVSADSPGLRDSVRHNESGLLYEYGNINALAETLCMLIENTSLRAQLEQGAIRWAQQFDWNTSAHAMNECIYAVVNRQITQAEETVQKVSLAQTV